MSKSTVYTYLILLIIPIVMSSCDSPYIHDPPEQPYRLTNVEITPENPSFDDTVKLKVIGEGEKGTVTSYNWIIENRVHSTPGDSLNWYKEDHNSIVEGKVEGKFKESVYQSLTGSIEFTIRYNK